MRKRRRQHGWIVCLVLFGVSVAAVWGGSATALAGALSTTLTAVKVTVPPTLDGKDTDAAWKKPQALRVPVAGGSIGAVTVTLKAVYTDNDLYILAQWPDKTMSVEHKPWVFDGSAWKQEELLEDRFAIQWNISVPAFLQAGCTVMCHSGTAYPDKLPRMHTNAPGEFADEWHWKAARSNPMGYVDDKYVDNIVDPKDDEAGHHADGGTRVYTSNKEKAGGPSFVWRGPTPAVPPVEGPGLARLVLLEQDAAPFSPINPLTGKPWAAGDKVPGALLREPTGSNQDIRAFGEWRDGRWTLEMSRALDTKENALKEGKRLDAVFDPQKTFSFAISVFDRGEAMDHSFSGPVVLRFKR